MALPLTRQYIIRLDFHTLDWLYGDVTAWYADDTEELQPNMNFGGEGEEDEDGDEDEDESE